MDINSKNTKIMNIGIWEIVASNQLFIRCFYTEIKFSKKTFFVMGPFFSSHSICLKIGFWQGRFVWK